MSNKPAPDVTLVRFPGKLSWIETTSCSTYEGEEDPTLELEVAHDGDSYGRLVHLRPTEALKLAHEIRRQARLMLKAQWLKEKS